MVYRFIMPACHAGETSSTLVSTAIWAVSSAGRTPALQAGGHRFDPDTVHHYINHFRSETYDVKLQYRKPNKIRDHSERSKRYSRP